MRKRLSILFVFAGIAFMMYSTSCTKCDDEAVALTIKNAIIKGDALANLDLSNDTNQNGGFEIQLEKVPNGIKIFARINSMDLDPNPSNMIDYQDITYETSVDNGKFEVTVQAGQGNVPVTILADDFEYNQKINDSTWEWKVFSLQNQNLTVINNQVKYNNLQFNTN
ncbi:MAG: hypothetical protein B6D61_03790 [Bacteroidetes bacterium 4484_249]|nr:MAG: hypothetical protein B6D61_03790 [Bacteroidetes bacterium 4484_249]